MFVINLTYQVPLETVDCFISQHIEYLNLQYEQGNFILSGRKEPRTGGVIISTLSEKADLNNILTQDPFYYEGIDHYEVIEIIPTKASAELAFLITE
ncbi:YciI family protein [Vibrio hepatarius]|uniref:YciI family protein n=1 Tax=Vibrio hepatarius TaxID=171383 RepID=UPI001C08101F|nr:YciI family protein [Vibrio hepatarius]MBU2896755.1 GTP cyclohydrolase [Vibrio hepatarius]